MIFEQSWEPRGVPADWKLANVVPIFQDSMKFLSCLSGEEVANHSYPLALQPLPSCTSDPAHPTPPLPCPLRTRISLPTPPVCSLPCSCLLTSLQWVAKAGREYFTNLHFQHETLPGKTTMCANTDSQNVGECA